MQFGLPLICRLIVQEERGRNALPGLSTTFVLQPFDGCPLSTQKCVVELRHYGIVACRVRFTFTNPPSDWGILLTNHMHVKGTRLLNIGTATIAQTHSDLFNGQRRQATNQRYSAANRSHSSNVWIVSTSWEQAQRDSQFIHRNSVRFSDRNRNDNCPLAPSLCASLWVPGKQVTKWFNCVQR